MVAASAPTLTSITPNSELRGTSVNVTLVGTNFTTGSTVHVARTTTGFTISAVTVTSATTITATSTASTPLGALSIYVAASGGSSNTLPFTVNGPVLTSICASATVGGTCVTPASGNRGTAVYVTLTGTGLSGTTTRSMRKRHFSRVSPAWGWNRKNSPLISSGTQFSR